MKREEELKSVINRLRSRKKWAEQETFVQRTKNMVNRHFFAADLF